MMMMMMLMGMPLDYGGGYYGGDDAKLSPIRNDSNDTWEGMTHMRSILMMIMMMMTTIFCLRPDKLCCEWVNSSGGGVARGLLSDGQVCHHHQIPSPTYS